MVAKLEIESDPRSGFLIAMYNQLLNDINRHIVVVWQSVATLVAAIASFSLVEKNIVSAGVATSIVLLVCFWLIAHVLDAGHWYNRNLVMIANIERQFLKQTDLKEIHAYFSKHRPENKLISHLRIQLWLGISVAILFIIFHLQSSIAVKISASTELNFTDWLPVGICVAGICVCLCFKASLDAKYEEFVKLSPGKEVDGRGFEFQHGHGGKQ
ncbi:hypothetical protein [uncultured Litoreibacter sp.]|uniref:hypothetical protein n=1 Tax=uncultured Litoreibacter sp. TaxID=1392394 RepID=UPI002616EF1D|nr:hypothetical protein [uncultured Litoreibacter sp.]